MCIYKSAEIMYRASTIKIYCVNRGHVIYIRNDYILSVIYVNKLRDIITIIIIVIVIIMIDTR